MGKSAEHIAKETPGDHHSRPVRNEPIEVVALLNRFFAVVVEVVESHGGWVNKFEGDAALAIFGAPLHLDDAPTRTLAAARELAARLAAEVPEVRAAVGVSGGEAVAGLHIVHRLPVTLQRHAFT